MRKGLCRVGAPIIDKPGVRCHYSNMIGKIENRLSLLAICFVIIYLIAAGLTVHSRISEVDRTVRFEGTGPPPGGSAKRIDAAETAAAPSRPRWDSNP